MKTSFVIVGFFVLGVLSGYSDLVPQVLGSTDISMYVLFLLMILVGMSIGSDRKLKEILKTLQPKILLIPAATITGTLAASALISLGIARWGMTECLAAGSGMGYYSLSSILITDLKEASLGAQLAASLGTIALMSNILRELFTLLLAPLLVRSFGPLAPICAGGATTMDSTLPVITAYSGKQWTFIAIVHGIAVDFSVPILVSFFCTL